MSDNNYYIYGGGRWRKVDVNEGRVEGWGRASFVYPRRGKVHSAKTKSVLTALKNLAAKKKSCAKDGARLPQKKLTLLKFKTDRAEKETNYDGSCCCQHANGNGCNPNIDNKMSTSTQCIIKVDASIQTSQTILYSENKKRRRESTSSDDIPTKNITTNALVHKSPKKSNLSLKRKRLSNENIRHSPKKKDIKSQETHEVPKDIKSPIKSQSDTRKSSQNDVKKPSQNDVKKSSQSDVKKSSQSDVKKSSQSDVKKSSQNKNIEKDQCKELIIDDADVDLFRRYLMKTNEDFDPLRFELDDEYKTEFFFKINPLVNVERCPQIAIMIQNSKKDFVSQLGLKSVTEITKRPRYKIRKPTPSIHSNKDLKDTQNSISNTESDSSNIIYNKYKKSKLLKEKNKNKLPTDTSNSDDNSNIIKKDKINKKDKIINNSEDLFKSQEYKEKSQIKQKENNKQQKENSKPKSNIIDNYKKLTEKVTEVIKQGNTHAISKRPSIHTMREYTNLEDHAIVSWLSVGDRAKYVNGNRIWRQLEEQYLRLTGQSRTFHSLRNRYLRYILPSLGILALPSADVTRLRAAAATGEIKSRKEPQRRNSIFAVPSRGALSRRPGALHNQSEPNIRDASESPPPKHRHPSPLRRSPRYSEITRHFAAKHRQDDSTPTDTPTQSPTRNKTTEKSTKTPDSIRKSRENTKKTVHDKKKSLDRSKQSPERSEKSSERAKMSLDRSKKSSSDKSPARSKKSLDRSKKSPERPKKSPERSKKSLNNSKQSHNSKKSLNNSKLLEKAEKSLKRKRSTDSSEMSDSTESSDNFTIGSRSSKSSLESSKDVPATNLSPNSKGSPVKFKKLPHKSKKSLEMEIKDTSVSESSDSSVPEMRRSFRKIAKSPARALRTRKLFNPSVVL